MREYGTVPTSLWSSAAFHACGQDAQVLFLFLLSGPHTTMCGCFRAPAGYISEDFGWPQERVSKAFRELSEKGFVSLDERAGWVLVPMVLNTFRSWNPNQCKAAAKLVDAIPNGVQLKRSVIIALINASESLSEGFRKAFGSVFEGFRNQEQKQEQEPKQFSPSQERGILQDKALGGAVVPLVRGAG